MKKAGLLKRTIQHKYFYLMLAPCLLYYFAFSYVPMYGIQVAFRDFSYVNPFGGAWAGLKYFNEALNDYMLMQTIGNTLVISVMKLITGFPAPVIIALLLNEIIGRKSKRIYQTVFTFPHFISWVVASGLILNILASSGILNQVLHFFGLPSQDILTSETAFRPMLYVTDIWKEAGWGSIIYLATIASIDPEIFEAARVDGANRFQQMRFITIPSLYSVMAILFILSIARIMDAGFDQIFNLYNPSVSGVAEIIDTYLYKRTFINGMSFSSSAALGLAKSVVNTILLLSANYIFKRLRGSGIYS